jgi:hypothetical protein
MRPALFKGLCSGSKENTITPAKAMNAENHLNQSGAQRPDPVFEITIRSVPVLGHSNIPVRASFGQDNRARTFGACCARGRAHSAAVHPADLAANNQPEKIGCASELRRIMEVLS